MAEVGSAFVSLMPSARGFGRASERQISPELKTSGGRMGKVLGGTMALAGGAALAGGFAAAKFLGTAFGEARDAQKVGALTAAVIKSTGGAANVTAKQVENLANKLSLKSGVDDELVQSGENVLLTFRNIDNQAGKGNNIFDRTTRATLNLSAALGKDMKSSAIQVGKALNDPVKGMTALGRAGVQFSAKQVDTVKSLVKTGDTLDAQKIILKELNSEFGGAAASQATAGDKFKVAWLNFAETVGTALLPLFDKILTGATRLVTFMSANFGPGLARIGEFIAPAVAGVKQLFASLSAGGGAGGAAASFATFGNAVKTVLPAVISLAQTIGRGLGPVLAQIATIIVTRVIPIIASFARFFYTQIIPAVVKIAQQVGHNLKPAFDQLVKTFQTQVLPALSKLLVKFHEWQPTIQKVISVVVQIIGKFIVFQSAITGRVLPVVIKLAGFLIGALVRAMIKSGGTIISITSKAIAFGSALIAVGKKAVEFAATVDRKIADVVRAVVGLGAKVTGAVSNFGSLLVHAGEALIGGLISGITSKIGELKSKLSELTGLIPKLKGPPATDAKLLYGNGRLIMGGLIDGIESGKADLASSLGSITRDIPGGSGLTFAGRGGGAARRSGPLVVIENLHARDEERAMRAANRHAQRALALAAMP